MTGIERNLFRVYFLNYIIGVKLILISYVVTMLVYKYKYEMELSGGKLMKVHRFPLKKSMAAPATTPLLPSRPLPRTLLVVTPP